MALFPFLKNDSALSTIPFIAVTALAMVGGREKLLASGFGGYIEKSVEPEILVSQIEAFLLKNALGSAPKGN